MVPRGGGVAGADGSAAPGAGEQGAGGRAAERGGRAPGAPARAAAGAPPPAARLQGAAPGGARPRGRAGEDPRGDLGRGPGERRGKRRWAGPAGEGGGDWVGAGAWLLGGFKGGDGGGTYPPIH